MNSLIPFDDPNLFDESTRVCLPYGLGIFDLSRWFNHISNNGATSELSLVAGAQTIYWSATDIIELFNTIQSNCLNYKLASSYVVSRSTKSLFFFDAHDRFSFFAADRDLLSKIYPFSREVIWENFALLQEDDEDLGLQEIFKIINTT